MRYGVFNFMYVPTYTYNDAVNIVGHSNSHSFFNSHVIMVNIKISHKIIFIDICGQNSTQITIHKPYKI